VFKKILVPLDGSKFAIDALKMAIEIAKPFHSQITLLHVGSLSTLLPLKRYERTQQVTSEDITRFIALARETGFTILAQGRQLVEDSGTSVKTIFKEGHPALEIVRIAQDGGFNLIVLGAKGISHIKELRLGGTSEQIVRNAPCTIMVYKPTNLTKSAK
jgi:nucleotide-binding universal stress UspA family protein